jgi:hypothetical protein
MCATCPFIYMLLHPCSKCAPISSTVTRSTPHLPCVRGLHTNVPLGGGEGGGPQVSALHRPLLDCLVATRLLEASVQAVVDNTGCAAGAVGVICLGDFNSLPHSPSYQVRW